MGAKILQAEYNGKKNELFLSIVATLPIIPEALSAEVENTVLLPKMQEKRVLESIMTVKMEFNLGKK